MFELDYFSYPGAMTLKKVIEAYWEKRSKFPVVVVLKEHAGKEERPIYVVRSNITFDERGFPVINSKGVTT